MTHEAAEAIAVIAPPALETYWHIDVTGENVALSLALPGHLHGLAVTVVLQGLAATELSPAESRAPLDYMATKVEDNVFTCTTRVLTLVARKAAVPAIKH